MVAPNDLAGLVEAVSQIADRGGVAFGGTISCRIFAVLDGGDDGDRPGAA